MRKTIYFILNISFLTLIVLSCVYLNKDFFNNLNGSFNNFISIFVNPSTPILPPPDVPDNPIPTTPEAFVSNFVIWGWSLLNIDTYVFYFYDFLNFITKTTTYILIFPLVLLLLNVLFSLIFKENDLTFISRSKPLCFFEKRIKPILFTISSEVSNFKNSIIFKKFKWIHIIGILIFFNFLSILIDFITFYVMLFLTFDPILLFNFLSRTLINLTFMFTFIPLPLWFVLLIIFILKTRKVKAIRRIRSLEFKNRSFVEKTGIINFVVGPTGTGKTLTITDFALTQEINFKNKAFDLMLYNYSYFPNFNFSELEKYILNLIIHNKINSLYSCREIIKLRLKRLINSTKINSPLYQSYYSNNIFKDTGVKYLSLDEVIINYSQLFFIYIIQSSLIVSNYAIRSDISINSLGHFPLLNDDIFVNYYSNQSRLAHILDFDLLRLGKKIGETKNNFEFGVIAITEISKERGNQLTNRGIKKDESDANVLNDLTDIYFKIARQGAVINGYSFVKVLFDDQRASSLNADMREQAETILTIKSVDPVNNCLNFFFLDYLFNYFFNKVYKKFVPKFRYFREDSSFIFYIISNFLTHIIRSYNFKMNTYGYSVVNLSKVEDSLNSDDLKYFRINKKIFSSRYCTDAFSGFFDKKSSLNNSGLDDIPVYQNLKASSVELESQNSYWIRRIYDIFSSSEDVKDKNNNNDLL